VQMRCGYTGAQHVTLVGAHTLMQWLAEHSGGAGRSKHAAAQLIGILVVYLCSLTLRWWRNGHLVGACLRLWVWRWRVASTAI
jgi:hypothetical protein